jgi:hypothetical protein
MATALLIACTNAYAAADNGNPSSPVTSLRPLHKGYAFDHPRVLVQQRLFGFAHGVTLLAETCMRESGYRETLMPVYMAWREQQQPTIAASHSELAKYYFGDRAAEATEQDIAGALNLKRELDIKPGSKELHAACDTFTPAIKKQRYDLNQQFQLQSLASRLATAIAIEVRVETCQRGLSKDAAARLDDAMLQWQQTYGAEVEEAKSTLAQRWDTAQIDGSFDSWVAQARKNGKLDIASKSNVAPCNTLANWLLTQQADPDDAFNLEH